MLIVACSYNGKQANGWFSESGTYLIASIVLQQGQLEMKLAQESSCGGQTS